MTVKLFSFFSGAGFLDLGFEHTGFRVSFVNEYNPAFLGAYQYSRAVLRHEPPEYGHSPASITEFLTNGKNLFLKGLVRDARKDGSLLGFVGGPPCPDFSVGGKNRGQHGENGKLSRTYVDLICRLQPDFFLFENVKGLWSTKRHRRFYDELVCSILDAGYSISDRLINAIEYGAPQDRERIILLGFSKRSFGDSAPTGDLAFPWTEFASYPARSAFKLSWPKTTAFGENSELPCPPDIPVNLTVQHWFERNAVAEHPNATHCFKPRAGLARFTTVAEGDDSKKSFKRLHRWRYSPTACYGNNEVHLHPYKPRRISVAEALAIQSLPREYELPPQMSLSNMFKTVGNGVPYIAAKMLARSIMSFILQPYEIDNLRPRSHDRKIAYQSRLQLY